MYVNYPGHLSCNRKPIDELFVSEVLKKTVKISNKIVIAKFSLYVIIIITFSMKVILLFIQLFL